MLQYNKQKMKFERDTVRKRPGWVSDDGMESFEILFQRREILVTGTSLVDCILHLQHFILI